MKVSKFLPSSYKVLELLKLLNDHDFVFFVSSDERLREEVEQFENLFLVSSADEIPERLKFRYVNIERGREFPRDELLKLLSESGFERVDFVEGEGQFAVRGSIVDIFAHGFHSSESAFGYPHGWQVCCRRGDSKGCS